MDDDPTAVQLAGLCPCFFKQHPHHSYGRLHIVVVLVLLLAPLAASDVRGKFCGGMSYYTANSTYDMNIELLAATLPKKAASSGALFSTATTGSVPDAVHGLAQCRGDVDATTCDACLTGALEDARQLCVYDKDAAVYYDHCLLRYSNQNFLLDSNTTDGLGGVFLNSSTTENGDNDIVSSSPATRVLFDDSVRYLVKSVADSAANSSTRFATGVLQLAGEEQSWPKLLFGLAQCTPDISPTQCRTCLTNLLRFGSTRFSGKKTLTAHVLRCSYMYGGSSFFSGTPMLQLRMNVTQSPASNHHGKSKRALVLAVTLPIAAAVLAAGAILLWLLLRRRNRGPSLPDTFNPEDIKSINFLAIPLSTLRIATGNFCIGNLIGEGGFGTVYKGILPNNQEIAVKRLSQASRQGIQELRNEIISVAKLRHRNLVKMVGVCLDGPESLIVYEYLPNSSLDKLIFDPQRRSQLGPEKVMTIIVGIARGLQYVHEDSEARIIHRDLKASNILLDNELNPKISDFGLARILAVGQSHEVTSRAVGTIGYMAPEYARDGNYSVKSDVYSFGVLVLEIVTGNRNGGHHLLNLVWDHWDNGTVMDIIVGSSSLSSSSSGEIETLRRCVQVGLLCVHDRADDRPTMSAVNGMLLNINNSSILPQPSRARPPASVINSPGTGASTESRNDVSITELQPR